MEMVLRGTGCQLDSVDHANRCRSISRPESKVKRWRCVFIPSFRRAAFRSAAICAAAYDDNFPDLPIVVGYFGKARQFDKLLVKLRAAGASYVNTSIAQTRARSWRCCPR